MTTSTSRELRSNPAGHSGSPSPESSILAAAEHASVARRVIARFPTLHHECSRLDEASSQPSQAAWDLESECARVEQFIRDAVGPRLRKKGVVLGVSGGIDSSVCVVLAARALGSTRVHAILMPERESSAASLELGRAACAIAGVQPTVEDITAPLVALGCYQRRERAIRSVFPDFRDGDRFKIAIAGDLADSDRVSHFRAVATLAARGGAQVSARIPADAYLEIVAATNLKQRMRKTVEYTAADAGNLAVLGTPNMLEHALGFFVRGGDGLADLKPIAHLFKSQVFAIGRHLGLPAAITEQAPTTDTYSLPQTQQEFYFGMPHEILDRALACHARRIGADEAAPLLGMTPEQVRRVYRDIESKQRVAERLDGQALVLESACLDPH
jgi:NAD+ synthase